MFISNRDDTLNSKFMTFSSVKTSVKLLNLFLCIWYVREQSLNTCQTDWTPVLHLQNLLARGMFENLPNSIANECDPESSEKFSFTFKNTLWCKRF